MNTPDKTQEAQQEQLLKLIELQLADARKRRMAREEGRSKAGVIGIIVIVVAATIALGLLMMMLEQMRPEAVDSAEKLRTEAR